MKPVVQKDLIRIAVVACVCLGLFALAMTHQSRREFKDANLAKESGHGIIISNATAAGTEFWTIP